MATNVWWTYNIAARYWSSYILPINVTMHPGIRSGVDMNTGNVFIPGGADNGTQMVMNTPGLSSLPLTPMPTTLLPVPVVRASFVWSSYRNSFLHYGGQSITGNIANPNLIEFSPTSGWASVATIGPSPGDVSAYNGSKMIVFGGARLDGVTNADIHILNMATREWTLGKSADASHARRNMACAASGDSFVAWGGESALENKDGTPIVYDIRNNQWTSLFRRNTTIPVPTGSSTPISTVTPSPPPETTTNIAAIGGGVGGAILVVAIIGFLFYRRRRQKKANSNNKDGGDTGLNLREPQNTDGYRRTGLPESHPPPLKPRPMEDREAYFDRLAVSPPTSPVSGPQGLLRDPHGQPWFSVLNGDKSERIDNNDSDNNNNSNDDDGDGYEALHPPQRPPMPARISHLSDRTVTASGPYQSWSLSDSVDISINKADAQQQQQQQPQSLRSPHSPESDRQFYGLTTTQPIGPRSPQWLSRINGSAQDVSARNRYVDRNQYLDRSQELARMMETIRAEQEELERSRLEHEALMQNYRGGDPPSSPGP
ncbi:hypothetical protein BG015_002515 [Linnemannia schmuckeri]|uniref:Galactose oxidase n=1 Tax=Linnemannia schmuckeri TaxID=64567 RepID=A0A9P5VD44_9FUNG|nr:hypothetical protein BG015_002515 [Linnemannia schmuckeri]